LALGVFDEGYPRNVCVLDNKLDFYVFKLLKLKRNPGILNTFYLNRVRNKKYM